MDHQYRPPPCDNPHCPTCHPGVGLFGEATFSRWAARIGAGTFALATAALIALFNTSPAENTLLVISAGVLSCSATLGFVIAAVHLASPWSQGRLDQHRGEMALPLAPPVLFYVGLVLWAAALGESFTRALVVGALPTIFYMWHRMTKVWGRSAFTGKRQKKPSG